MRPFRFSGFVLAMVLAAGCAVVALSPVSAVAKSPGPACATTGSADFGVDLTGPGWRFRTGDDLAWADPGFDDSGWESRTVPDNWGETAQSSYDGFAWYRRTFTLPERPADLTDAGLIAALGFIDDADQTFLNGHEIGRTGGFPPNFDSAWDVPREYYPADGLLRWGATNVVAVRMYDGTGGGGFYKGPVGLFSKARLRSLAGIDGVAATKRQLAHACAVLDQQHQAVSVGDLSTYGSTLAAGFFHQGDTAERRLREVRALLARHGSVELRDAQAEVVVDRQGRLIVDTIRSWVAGGGREVVPAQREFLYLDPRDPVELGDHARFFRDSYESPAMGRRVQFNIYLPPSYTRTAAKRFPTVFMLHGVNGSNIEWEVRDMDAILDRLVAEGDMAESVVVFPDGSSGWYVDSSAGNYRTMIVRELLPLVDKEFRTIPDRDHRGISGVSMGGFGSFSIGLEHPDLFSSISSHMGALDLPPLAGTPEERAANSRYQPTLMVNSMTTDQLRRHTYYFDGGEQDEYRFGEAAKVMSASLTAKLVDHEWQTGPGHHNDAYWVPKLDRSFGLHSRQFRTHPYDQPVEPAPAVNGYTWP